MARKYVSFEELTGKTAAGQDPAHTAPFGGVGRPRTRLRDGVPVPGFDRATSVSHVFKCFLEHGLRPYPDVDGWDLMTSIHRLEACLAVPPDVMEAVAPDPRIGINPSYARRVEVPILAGR